MLILVAFVSFTRVETQVASNQQKIAMARQNALFALNIALGQLQRYAGPDHRVTATSDISSATAAKPHITGVWDANSLTGTEPMMWLVSGSEAPAANATQVLTNQVQPPAVNIPDPATSTSVFLVGNNSVSSDAQRIKVLKRSIVAPAGTVPGFTAATPIGNYAWWVGDEGVKASLALPDQANEVTYGPWSTPAERQRIRQQIGSVPASFRNSGSAVFGFDPLDALNRGNLGKVTQAAQLALLAPAGASAPGLRTHLKANFHDLTGAAYSVLANTLPSGDQSRGLLRDLSISPALLGSAFARYANYVNYTVPPVNPDSVERVVRIQLNQTNRSPGGTMPGAGDPQINFSYLVSPVLSEIMVRYKVQRAPADPAAPLAPRPVQVTCKLYVALWNPYTSAIELPPLPALAGVSGARRGFQIHVSGLPTITVRDESVIPPATASISINLGAALPSILKREPNLTSLRVHLGFPAGQTTWEPGRVYYWTTTSATSSYMETTNDASSRDSDASPS